MIYWSYSGNYFWRSVRRILSGYGERMLPSELGSIIDVQKAIKNGVLTTGWSSEIARCSERGSVLMYERAGRSGWCFMAFWVWSLYVFTTYQTAWRHAIHIRCIIRFRGDELYAGCACKWQHQPRYLAAEHFASAGAVLWRYDPNGADHLSEVSALYIQHPAGHAIR